MAFIRIPKHRYFNYQPLYYDEKKERMEQRLKEFGKTDDTEVKDDTYYPGKYLRGKMRDNVYEHRRSSMKPSLSRLLKISLFLIVMVLAYIFADRLLLLFY